jgi:hypothetical protein
MLTSKQWTFEITKSANHDVTMLNTPASCVDQRPSYLHALSMVLLCSVEWWFGQKFKRGPHLLPFHSFQLHHTYLSFYFIQSSCAVQLYIAWTKHQHFVICITNIIANVYRPSYYHTKSKPTDLTSVPKFLVHSYKSNIDCRILDFRFIF